MRFQARAACAGSQAADALRAAAELYAGDVANALASSATEATRDCAATKLRAMGRATRDALACHQRGRALVSCLSEARDRLADTLADAESMGPCATTNDFSALLARLDDFVDDVLRVLAPDATPYRGTYDVTFVFNPSSLGPSDGKAALGVAGVATDGRLTLNVYFDEYDQLSVSGILANGEFLISGYFFEGGDITMQAAGQAAATTDADSRRIGGSADIQGYNEGTVTFTLTRPLAGTPSSLGGSYVLAFPQSPSGCGCASGAAFDLTVAADGFATSAPATDARPDTTVEGTFGTGTCLVTPGGSVRCYSPYDPVAESGTEGAYCAEIFGGTCPIILHGKLPVPPPLPTGGGVFTTGAPPILSGTWTATR